jgi:hypothetical protein
MIGYRGKNTLKGGKFCRLAVVDGEIHAAVARPEKWPANCFDEPSESHLLSNRQEECP